MCKQHQLRNHVLLATIIRPPNLNLLFDLIFPRGPYLKCVASALAGCISRIHGSASNSSRFHENRRCFVHVKSLPVTSCFYGHTLNRFALVLANAKIRNNHASVSYGGVRVWLFISCTFGHIMWLVQSDSQETRCSSCSFVRKGSQKKLPRV